jgi:hypothetical protein
MSDADGLVKSGSMPNEAVLTPPVLERLVAKRAAVARDLEPEDPDLVATDEEVAARAEIVRRLFDKLGILPEIEELRRLDARRRDRLDKGERS